MNTSLIDRYVREVARHLPRKTRSDVEEELRSLLTDSLRDRIAGKQPIDDSAAEAEQVAVLRAFGPPSKAAARYAPPRRYLIGPNVFDLYTAVLLAVGIGITAIVLLLAGLSLLGGDGGRAPELADFLLLYVQWLFSAFGSITLAFAIVSRLLPEEAVPAEKEESWDPRTLPKVDDPAHIDPKSILFEIVCVVFALALFNFFPQWIGLNFTASENGGPARWYSIPMLSEPFYKNYLPWWNVNFLLTLLLNLFLLRRGRWERLTRIADFLLAALGGVLVTMMLADPTLVALQGVPSESLNEFLESVSSGLVKSILAVVLIIIVMDAAGKLVAIFRPHLPVPFARRKPAEEKESAEG